VSRKKAARRFNKPAWVIERYRNMSPEQKIDLVYELGRLTATFKKGLEQGPHGRCSS